MKYLKPVLESLDAAFVQDAGFVAMNGLSKKGLSVYSVGKCKGRFCYLVLDWSETSSKCALSAYLYSSVDDIFDPDYIPTEFPDEWDEKDATAFDIGFLSAEGGKVWSLFNDKLDSRFDGGLKGGEETIAKRGEEISKKIIDLVQGPLRQKLG